MDTMAVKKGLNPKLGRYNYSRVEDVYHGEIDPPKKKRKKPMTNSQVSQVKRAKVGRFKEKEAEMIRKYLIKYQKMIYLFDDQVKHFTVISDAKINRYFINTEKDDDKWITLGNLLAIKGIYDPITRTEFIFNLDKRWGEDIVMEYFETLLMQQHPDIQVGGFGMLDSNFQKGAINTIRVFIKISHLISNIDIIINKKAYERPTPR